MKIFNTLFLPVFCVLITLSSCTNYSDKIEAASLNIDDERMDYDVPDEQYQAEYKEYRAQANEMISDNEQRLIEFKSRIKKDNSDATLLYDRKVARLEAKNKELKEQLEEYKIGGKDQWESFKVEFDYDMTALGKSFNDLATEQSPI